MYPESRPCPRRPLTMDELIAQLSRRSPLSGRASLGIRPFTSPRRVVEISAGNRWVRSSRAHLPAAQETDTTFLVSADKRARLAQGCPPSRYRRRDQLVDPRVPKKFDCGGGCASRRRRLRALRSDLLNRGTLNERPRLGSQTVELMTADHLGAISRGTGATPWPGYTGGSVSPSARKGLAPIPGSPGDTTGRVPSRRMVGRPKRSGGVFMTQSPWGSLQHLMRASCTRRSQLTTRAAERAARSQLDARVRIAQRLVDDLGQGPRPRAISPW